MLKALVVVLAAVATAIAGSLLASAIERWLHKTPRYKTISLNKKIGIYACLFLIFLLIGMAVEDTLPLPPTDDPGKATPITTEEPNIASPTLEQDATPMQVPQQIETATPAAAAAATATPVEPKDDLGVPDFWDDFDPNKERHWTEGSDRDGRAWYGDGGFNILARDTKTGWVWPMRDKDYDDAVIEVEVTPKSHGTVTGYGLVMGWEKGNNYYLFEVQPNRGCRFYKVEAHRRIPISVIPVDCPQPSQDHVVSLRLEVLDGHFVAFMDGELVTQEVISDYEGGLIGFETYNGGRPSSAVEAHVFFDNLAVWSIPMWDTEEGTYFNR